MKNKSFMHTWLVNLSLLIITPAIAIAIIVGPAMLLISFGLSKDVSYMSTLGFYAIITFTTFVTIEEIRNKEKHK